jgi:hypothetical protein
VDRFARRRCVLGVGLGLAIRFQLAAVEALGWIVAEPVN